MPHQVPPVETLAGASCLLWDCDGDLGLQLAMDLLLRGGSVTVFSLDNGFLDRARVEAEDIRADERFTAVREDWASRFEEILFEAGSHSRIFLVGGLGGIWSQAVDGELTGECTEGISSLSIGTAEKSDFTHDFFRRRIRPDIHTEAATHATAHLGIVLAASRQAGSTFRIRFPSFLERLPERCAPGFDIFLPLFDDSVCRDIVPRQMLKAVMSPSENLLEVHLLADDGEHYRAQEIPVPGDGMALPGPVEGWSTLGRVERVSVRDTPLGKGLFAERDFTTGETIIHEKGFMLDFQTGHTLQTSHSEHLDVGLPARNLNHSCEPNVGIRSGPVTAWPRIVAFRDIRRGEELTLDYAMAEYRHYERPDPGKGIRWEFACACNTPSCRGRMGYYSELPWALRDRYRGFVAGYLESA